MTAAAFLRDLVTTRDSAALARRGQQVDLAELAALTAVVVARLAARRFGTADDLRIRPYAAAIASRSEIVDPVAFERLIRGVLGDGAQLRMVPPAQVTALQILLIGKLVAEWRMPLPELESIIDAAVPATRSYLRQAR